MPYLLGLIFMNSELAEKVRYNKGKMTITEFNLIDVQLFVVLSRFTVVLPLKSSLDVIKLLHAQVS